MTMHLPADLHATIRQRVASGDYGDESEVIRAALAALTARDHERLQLLRAKVAEGFAEIERGEGIEWTPALMDDIEREVEELYLQGAQPDPDDDDGP